MRVLDWVSILLSGVGASCFTIIFTNIIVPSLLFKEANSDTFKIFYKIREERINFIVQNNSDEIIDLVDLFISIKNDPLSSMGSYPVITKVYGGSFVSLVKEELSEESFDFEVEIYQSIAPKERDHFVVELTTGIDYKSVIGKAIDTKGNIYYLEKEM